MAPNAVRVPEELLFLWFDAGDSGFVVAFGFLFFESDFIGDNVG